MPTLVIGSTAMKKLLPDTREPSDLDLLSDYEEPSRGIDVHWHDKYYDWLGRDQYERYATLDELYTIKVSHAPWPLQNGTWAKHMSDVVTLKQAGAILDLGLYKMLYSIWTEVHGSKRVNLQMSKEDFFTDAVQRIYDHDSIHYSVAYGDRPIYESCFKDGQEIEMDMAKIKALPFDECVRLFREEIYATALERWVIPSNYICSPRQAYADAVKKTIVSLTKGWSSRFITENYGVFRVPDMDYVAHHLSKKDQLIPLEGSDGSNSSKVS